jgi:AcrR family transcriptional regulator
MESKLVLDRELHYRHNSYDQINKLVIDTQDRIMPKWFSEQDKEKIRNKLLEHGYKFFSTYGFKKTSIDDIARAAGISKGAFYRFYESKEMLFMDVIEQVEITVRIKIMELIDAPGQSPRVRLFNILKGAFAIFQELPILRNFSGNDFDLIFRMVPADKFQEHIASDSEFFQELFNRCEAAEIPIKVKAGQIVGLLYPLVIAFLNNKESDKMNFFGSINMNLELIAAFCLGEVELKSQNGDITQDISQEGNKE